MPTPFAEDHSYAAVVNMRPTHPQELASEQATQTPGVTLDVTPSQANIRNTPYDKGHEPVTPSEAQTPAPLASRNAAVSGRRCGGQSPKHPSRPGDIHARFDRVEPHGFCIYAASRRLKNRTCHRKHSANDNNALVAWRIGRRGWNGVQRTH